MSPLQLAVAYSALVNGGTVVRPHVGEAVIRDGVAPQAPLQARAEAEALALHVGDQAGPLRGGEQPRRHVAAGLRGLPDQGRRQDGNRQTPDPVSSWYASWAPYNSPKLVVVVIVEHGGFGAEAAAPTAKKIYAAYFHLKG